MSKSQRIIQDDPKLIVKNLEVLPRGVGSRVKYLEVIESHKKGEYIAKQWREKLPETSGVFIKLHPLRKGRTDKCRSGGNMEKFHYCKTDAGVALECGFRINKSSATCKYCDKQYKRGRKEPSLQKRMIGHYEYHIRHRPDKKGNAIRGASHGFKKYDHVVIIGKRKNDPNGRGMIERVGERGVYISNMNMPYYGTYASKYFPFSKVRKA